MALIADEIEAYVEENKLLIDPLSPERGDLARRSMRAETEAPERTLERDQGDYSAGPKDLIVKPVMATAREQAASGETIMELFEIYAGDDPTRAISVSGSRIDVKSRRTVTPFSLPIFEAIRLGATGLDAVKQIALVRIERPPARLDLAACPHLPKTA